MKKETKTAGAVRVVVGCLLGLSSWVGVPSAAWACWDGLRAHSGSGVEVVLPVGGEETAEWSSALAHDYAALLPRLAQVAGEGAWVYVAPWEIEVCVDDQARRCLHQEAPQWSSPAEILAAVGALVGASPSAVRAAQGREVPVWTVVVRSARGEEPALAARLHQAGLALTHGNVEVGGFPADNPAAHPLPAGGAVAVGTFLEAEQAAAQAARLTEAGFPATVQRLRR